MVKAATTLIVEGACLAGESIQLFFGNRNR
jgi:hypothetical protein